MESDFKMDIFNMKFKPNTNSWKLLLTSILLTIAPATPAASSQPEQTEFSSNFGKYCEQVASDELQGRAPAGSVQPLLVETFSSQVCLTWQNSLNPELFTKNCYKYR
jgi:hypothetical protein